MTCWCETKSPSKYCYTNEQDGRIAYRLYCPECKGFVGSKVRKEVALACGYDLEYQEGNVTDYRCRKIVDQIYSFLPLPGLGRIGVKKLFTHHNYYLFNNRTKDELLYIPEFFISWGKFSTDEFIKRLVNNIVDLTPVEPIYRPKVPRDLLADYSAYIESPQWQRKRSERMAIDRKQCVLCGSVQNLQVHHVTYERLFNEKMQDLMTVCHGCHEVLHDREF